MSNPTSPLSSFQRRVELAAAEVDEWQEILANSKAPQVRLLQDECVTLGQRIAEVAKFRDPSTAVQQRLFTLLGCRAALVDLGTPCTLKTAATVEAISARIQYTNNRINQRGTCASEHLQLCTLATNLDDAEARRASLDKPFTPFQQHIFFAAQEFEERYQLLDLLCVTKRTGTQGRLHLVSNLRNMMLPFLSIPRAAPTIAQELQILETMGAHTPIVWIYLNQMNLFDSSTSQLVAEYCGTAFGKRQKEFEYLQDGRERTEKLMETKRAILERIRMQNPDFNDDAQRRIAEDDPDMQKVEQKEDEEREFTKKFSRGLLMEAGIDDEVFSAAQRARLTSLAANLKRETESKQQSEPQQTTTTTAT